MLRNKHQFAIAEMFYSIQGEGHFAGTPAYFIRLAGCNRECPFCDTDHTVKFHGTAEEIVSIILARTKHIELSPLTVILTGGEPFEQPINEIGLEIKDRCNWRVHVESNGEGQYKPIWPKPSDSWSYRAFDWLTISPKEQHALNTMAGDECKIVYPSNIDPNKYRRDNPDFACWYIQPLWDKDEIKRQETMNQAIDFVKCNPVWRLSLQTHKMIGVQ